MQNEQFKNIIEIRKIETYAVSFLISGLIILISGICFYIDYRIRTAGDASIELQDKVNPNTASVCSLMRLPNIGRGRANDIFNYREAYGYDKPFQSCWDLQKVKGIGPAISGDICGYLRFE